MEGMVITMSMEINNYSSYATNYTERIKKSDSKAATEVKTGTSANSNIMRNCVKSSRRLLLIRVAVL